MGSPKSKPLQTEFEFTLPKGYLDKEGKLHQKGSMRLSTAMDEIVPLRDQRVKNNQAYLTILILSRVITSLGEVQEIEPEVVENLFTADLGYLQDFYRRINGDGENSTIEVTCPECQNVFSVIGAEAGGS